MSSQVEVQTQHEIFKLYRHGILTAEDVATFEFFNCGSWVYHLIKDDVKYAIVGGEITNEYAGGLYLFKIMCIGELSFMLCANCDCELCYHCRNTQEPEREEMKDLSDDFNQPWHTMDKYK